MIRSLPSSSSSLRVLTICSGRGGVGKTTIARAIIRIFKERYRIAIIDGALGLGGISSFYAVNQNIHQSYERYLDSDLPPSDFVCQIGDIQLIPSYSKGTIEDFGLDRKYTRIAEMIKYLGDNNDLIIIDAPSFLDLGLYEYLGLSNMILVVVANDSQSIANGYAISKVASTITPEPAISFFLNMADTEADFVNFNIKMRLLSTKFLHCELKASGFMKFDEQFMKSSGDMELGSMIGNDNRNNMNEFFGAIEELLGGRMRVKGERQSAENRSLIQFPGRRN